MEAEDADANSPGTEPNHAEGADSGPSQALEQQHESAEIQAAERPVVDVASLGELERQAPPATPARGARLLAFVAILVGGACGGLIGWGFTDLQCSGDCGTWSAMGGLVGAVVGAGGLAIVAVLGLRAIAEWESVQDPEAHRNHPGRARPSDGKK